LDDDQPAQRALELKLISFGYSRSLGNMAGIPEVKQGGSSPVSRLMTVSASKQRHRRWDVGGFSREVFRGCYESITRDIPTQNVTLVVFLWEAKPSDAANFDASRGPQVEESSRCFCQGWWNSDGQPCLWCQTHQESPEGATEASHRHSGRSFPDVWDRNLLTRCYTLVI
jgi:hypothetical protein